MIEIFSDIVELYNQYKSMKPLDLKGSGTERQFSRWRESHRLSLFEFSRVVALLQHRTSLKSVTKANTDLDFDNIQPVLEVLYEAGHLHFTVNDSYKISGLSLPHKLKQPLKLQAVYAKPNARLNQFPCTVGSRLNRIKKLLTDYPHVSSMRVGFLGDDDLVSTALAAVTPFTPVVIEIDRSIIREISQAKIDRGLNIEIIEGDLSDNLDIDVGFDTFFTDPPYTLPGILWFLYHGCRLLRTKDRAYFVINQMMVGKAGLLDMFKVLTHAGAFPIEVLPAFNEYPLPTHYRETNDLSEELAVMGSALSSDAMSSASSLVVLQTTYVDAEVIRLGIEEDKDIYLRY